MSTFCTCSLFWLRHVACGHFTSLRDMSLRRNRLRA
jgi:hypothetical protein